MSLGVDRLQSSGVRWDLSSRSTGVISVMSRGSSGPMSANVTTPVTAATPSTYRP